MAKISKVIFFSADINNKETKNERKTAMGMSASQARFLSLTARKNNVEFQGQQINQQRTTLSNESSSYYSELCNMVVPTPPSVDDYTKITYTFDDGALTNTVTSMLVNPDPKKQGLYSISYIQQWQDDYSIVSSSSSLISKSPEKVQSVRECTPDEINKIEYYYFNAVLNAAEQAYKEADGTYYTMDKDGNKTPLTGVTEDDLVMCIYDETQTDPNKAVSLVAKDADGKYVREAEVEKDTYKIGTSTLRKLGSMLDYNREADPYLSSLTDKQLDDLMEQEKYYRSMLNDYQSNNPGSTNDWYVRYIKDTTSGTYVPYFYSASEVDDENKYNTDGYATSNINCYSIGSSTKTKEVMNQTGRVEKDSSGRYIAITIYQTDEAGNIKKDAQTGAELCATYSLTTNTITDEEAYNDALNQYRYEQNQYDKKIQEINSKLEIVQQQDKSLELNLKQLDTEENAISTELEAVKKVISKNIDSSFKTFNA